MSDSDSVEIVEKKPASPSRAAKTDICQLCPTNLHGLSRAERDSHYDSHNQRPKPQTARRGRPKSISVATSDRRTTLIKFKESAAQEDIFWHASQTRAPPDNYTPGALSILKEALKQSYRKGSIKRAVVCYERTPHIYRESFDANWGCGYRNFMMTCAALMDQKDQTLYFSCIDDPLPPGVRNLQHWLEDAWTHGYDSVGASDFNHKIVDTKKRIGTGELYVAFTSRKIPCTLVDFDIKNSPKGFDILIDWVVNYFSEKPEGDAYNVLLTASPVVASRKMPVIMQYDGHSVTIVGYELAKNGKHNLLVFDPSSKVDKNIRKAALSLSTGVDWAASPSVSLGKSRRRDQSKSPDSKKRPRTNQDPNDGVVSIVDSDDEIGNAHQAVASKPTLEPDVVIKAFRLKAIKKKYEYQLLYFTMENILSDEEQNNRKVVLSVPGS